MSDQAPRPEPGRKTWSERFREATPSRETLASSRWLKPLADHIHDPRLWHFDHESVARGVAIGLFWAFAIPVAQIILAAAHSVWWRANIPVAAGMTLITNPLTVGFWLWLAYQLGSTVLGSATVAPMADGAGITQWLTTFGGPALLGMGIFAVAGGVTGYLIVHLVWRLHMWLKRQQR